MADDALLLTVVGSAAAWTRRPGAASSCYLVEARDAGIVLDLGQGSFASLAGHTDPAGLAAVLVSHLHPDHGIDLVPLRHYLRYGRAERRSVPLHAPADLRRRYDELLGEEGFLDDLVGPDLARGTRRIGPFEVLVREVTHSVNSFGFRVSLADGEGDARRGLVYSGDCSKKEDVVPLITRGDTLLCEAAFGDRPTVEAAGHLNSMDAAWAAREGGASRLVLTHILDEIDPERALTTARESFSGEVLLARPGLQLRI